MVGGQGKWKGNMGREGASKFWKSRREEKEKEQAEGKIGKEGGKGRFLGKGAEGTDYICQVLRMKQCIFAKFKE
jgi:hypothetical protein